MPVLSIVIPKGKILFIQEYPLRDSLMKWDGPRDQIMQVIMNLEREFNRLESELSVLYRQSCCCQLHHNEHKADIAVRHSNLAVLQRRLDQEARNFQILAKNERLGEKALSVESRHNKATQTDVVDVSDEDSPPPQGLLSSPVLSQTLDDSNDPEILHRFQEPKIPYTAYPNQIGFRFKGALAAEERPKEGDDFFPWHPPSQKRLSLLKPLSPKLLQNSSLTQKSPILDKRSSIPCPSPPHALIPSDLSWRMSNQENELMFPTPWQIPVQTSISPEKTTLDINNQSSSSSETLSVRCVAKKDRFEPKPQKEHLHESNSELHSEPPALRLSQILSDLIICEDVDGKIPEDVDVKILQDVDVKIPEDVDVKILQDVDVKIPEDVDVKIPEDVDVKILQDVDVKIPEDVDVKIPEDVDVKIPEDVDVKILQDVDVKISEDVDVKIPEDVDVKILQDVDVKIPEDVDVKILQDVDVKIPEDVDVKIPEDVDVKIPQDLLIKPAVEPGGMIPQYLASDAKPLSCNQLKVFTDKWTQTGTMDDIDDVVQPEQELQQVPLGDLNPVNNEVDEMDSPPVCVAKDCGCFFKG